MRLTDRREPPIFKGGKRGLNLAILGIALLLSATLLAYRLPAARALDAPDTVFSGSRAMLILKELIGGNVPHPIGSAANVHVRQLIVQRLTALGYDPQLQSGFICNNRGACGTPTNIIATLAGSDADADADAVLLAAHYDSVPAGPGASDDGAGVAAVLEIARILKLTPARGHPVILLLTDGEEAGLLGASLFVREHPLSRRVGAAINLEARGVSGPSLMFETGSANQWLMHLYAGAIRDPSTNSLYYVVYKTLPNDTDFTVFKAAAYQGFNFAFIGDVAHYHTPLDTWANADARTLQQQGDNALAAVLALEAASNLRAPPSESIFFDVFGRTLIVWPASIALPAAIGVLILLLAEGIVLLMFREVRVRQLLWGASGALTHVLLGGALSVAVIAFLEACAKLPPLNAGPWIAHPLPMDIASAFLAFLSAGCVAAGFAKRAGFWGFWLGSAGLIATLGVAVSAIVPGASYLPLLTGLAAALAALPFVLQLLRKRPPPRAATHWIALIPCWAMFALLLPMLLLLYSALGALAWVIGATVLCMATSWLLAVLAETPRDARRMLIGSAAAVCLAGMAATLIVPVYSERWPQRVNIEYWLDADHAKARWWALPASGRLPSALKTDFGPHPQQNLPASPITGFAADAPNLDLPPPELTVTSRAGTHYALRVRSARAAPNVFVIFPASAHIDDIALPSLGSAHAKLQRLPGGATALKFANLDDAGMDFAIEAPVAAMPVVVFDQSFALPAELAQGKALQQARPRNATSSQDGDTTVVERTVTLDPAAGR
jgi:hypothetical protein